MKSITNPQELREAIELAKTDESVIHEIATYKWYNWYQNIHVKKDSPEDIENTQIFDELKQNDPELHAKIEKVIDGKIYMLVSKEYW